MNLIFTMKYIITIFLSKKSYVAVSFLSSFSLTVILEKIYLHIEEQGSLASLTTLFVLVMLTGTFIMIDFITGIIASKYEGKNIHSSKWGVTIGKFFGLLLYFALSAIILILVSDNYFALTFVFGPVILTLLKEYISIGENLQRRFGKKAYIFNVIDKMFDILELKFFKSLEQKRICGKETQEKGINVDKNENLSEKK